MSWSSPVNVTIVANDFQPDYILNLVRGLTSNGVTVDLIGSALYDRARLPPTVRFLALRNAPTRLTSRTARAFGMAGYYLRLLRYSASTPNTLFHVPWWRFNLIEGVLLTLLLKGMGKRIVYTAHNVLPHDADTARNRVVFRWIYRLADRIVVHTAFIKDRIVRELTIPEAKIAVMRHGVCSVRRDPTLDEVQARKDMGIGRHDRVVLFFGQIARYKGLQVLAAAFRRCLPQHKDYRLIVAGEPKPSYRQEMDRILTELAPTGRLLCRVSHVADVKVEVLFRISDVVVLPCLETSQSGVLFLACAYGVPVVAPAIGGFPQDVLPGVTGQLFKTGDTQDLAEKLAACAADPLNAEMRANIKRLVHQQTWEAVCAELEPVYRAALEGKR